MSQSTPKAIYSPSEIRTSNMLPDRSADVVNNEPSLTQQHFVEECDINFIMKRYEATGLIVNPARGTPIVGDFSEFGDATAFQSAQNYIAEANEAFMSLPATTRKRFNNDPAELLDFVQNPDNREEAIRLGFIPSPTPPSSPQAKPTENASQVPLEPAQ